MSCYNGHTQASHRTKRGAFIRTKGKCKPAPKNCGPHAHGSVWWKPTGQVSKAVNCPHGGNKKKVFQKLTQMRCQNGSKINTQKTKRGNLIKTVGKCKSAPKNCGPHAHGSAWWKRTGKERVVHACPHGGKKVEVYEKLTQKRCKNGNVSNGATKRGSLIRVNNKCKAPKPPKKNKKGRKKKKS